MKPFYQILLATLLFAAACNLEKIDHVDPVGCNGAVKAAFAVDKTSGEAPCEITFTNTTTGATSFDWTFTSSQKSNAQNPGKITFSEAGNYEVVLIASNTDGCADTTEVTVMIVDPQMPVKACFAASQTNDGAAPSLTSFSALCSQNATTFSWNFGDPSSSTNTANGIDAQHTFTTAGTYPVKLTTNGPSGSDDTTVNIIVKAPQPKASFAVLNDGCDAPCTVQFSNTSQNAVSHSWDFGDGGNSVQTSPTHIYQNKGIYTVKLIVNGADGSKDTATNNVTVIKLPVADFTFTNDNCVGPCAVTFTSSSQNTSAHIWNFGDGSATSSATNPAHTFQTKGVFNVQLIAINADGSDTITKSVTIKSTNFKAVITVNNQDLTPLYGVERTDGKFHILYDQNGYKSVLISADQSVGNIGSYTASGLDDRKDIKPSGDGGFVIAGSNLTTNKAVLVKIGSTQVTSFNSSITFAGTAQLSQGQGVMLNPSNQFVFTGAYIPTGGGSMYPGFTFVSQSGTTSGNTFVNAPVANIGSLSGTGLTQLSNNQYVIMAPQWAFGGDPDSYLVKTSSSGAYSTNKNLGIDIQMEQILSVGTASFLLMKDNGTTKVTKYDQSLNAQGSISPSSVTILQILISNDGNLILSGHKNGSIWMAKYNSSTMSATPIWEKTYADASGTVSAASLAPTADGGFLITGKFVSGTGQNKLFLIKTDAEGNAD